MRVLDSFTPIGNGIPGSFVATRSTPPL